METDALIQRSIREEFTDCTTLVIAHRLQTVADYDRVLVLGDGEVLVSYTPRLGSSLTLSLIFCLQEYDSPWNLLQKNGMFHDMAQQSGDFDILMEIARKSAGVEQE